MPDTLWGTRVAGSHGAIAEDGTGHLVILGTPDWIRTPPELGGQEFRVSRTYMRECPCRRPHQSQTFELAGCDFQVSECAEAGFLWWR